MQGERGEGGGGGGNQPCGVDQANICYQPCKLLNVVIPAQVAMSNMPCLLSSFQRWAGVSVCKGEGGGLYIQST